MISLRSISRSSLTSHVLKRGYISSAFWSAPKESASKKKSAEPSGESLNKAELIQLVAKETKFTQEETKKVVDVLIKTLITELSHKKSFVLRGFGSFSTYESAARTGRNPSTGESLQIPAKRRVKFSASKDLKEAIQGK